jgi:beta-lactamase superfamily II metal-dependent hydrolase
MFEIDFLPVGDAGKSGDAICMRFTRPDSGATAVVVIDAGFKDDGIALADHIIAHYGTRTVDLAILTHPDGDHIGGMGKVLRRLDVTKLWLHDIGSHGGDSLPAADALDDLKAVAASRGTDVYEAWPGATEFGGAITVLGPSKEYYEELVAEQASKVKPVEKTAARLLESVRSLADRVAGALGIEVPFDAKEVNARNNSAMIILGQFNGQTQLFTSDAGVAALERAWDYAEHAIVPATPSMVQIAHHGSRRNCSSAWLDRLLGPTNQAANTRSAIVSCVADSEKHPSGRVVNAYKRRGCFVVATAGNAVCHNSGGMVRNGWGRASELGPMVEEDDD